MTPVSNLEENHFYSKDYLQILMCGVLNNKSQRILSMDENLHEFIIKLRRNNHFYVNIHDYRKDTIVIGYITASSRI